MRGDYEECTYFENSRIKKNKEQNLCIYGHLFSRKIKKKSQNYMYGN